MKYSLYKVVIFIFQLIIMGLLVILSIHLKAFDFLTDIKYFEVLKVIFNNDYVVSILSSMLSILILYFLQINYSKHKIKEDFRCHEIMSGFIEGIKSANELLKLSNLLEKDFDNIDIKETEKYLSNEKIKAKKYFDFYDKNKVTFSTCNLYFTYHNNQILIDSIQSVFFINLNFRLLNIVNNLKNRRPNLVDRFPEIEELYLKYNKNKNKNDLMKFGEAIKSYIRDINFMSSYIMDLLNYLNYDMLFYETYMFMFNKKYQNIVEFHNFLKLPYDDRKKIEKEIMSKTKKALLIYKIRNFFYKDS